MISLILINYHTEQLLIDCFHSIISCDEYANVEFIVVNNGGELIELTSIFSNRLNLTIIDAGGNIGFSSANNLGFAHASGDFVLFLNSDTRFVEPILSAMHSELENDVSVGIVGCKLVNTDLSIQLSYHDGDRIFRNLWYRNPFAIKFLNVSSRIRHMKNQLQVNHNEKHDARWLSGACIMVRKADVDAFKWNWDDSFFMYWEDVELCYRVRKTGRKVRYLPTIQLIHYGGGGETDFSSKRFQVMEKSKLMFIDKSRGIGVRKFYVFLMRCELKIEKWLEERRKPIEKNSILQQELDFYIKKR